MEGLPSTIMVVVVVVGKVCASGSGCLAGLESRVVKEYRRSARTISEEFDDQRALTSTIQKS